MPRVDLAFFTLASACLIAGVGMGIYMGVSRNFALAPAHAHLNLLGWVSLALYGIAYRLYPQLSGTRISTTHFVLSGSSAVLFPMGLYLEIADNNVLLVTVAAPMWLAGALLFFVLLARLVFSPSPRATHAPAE